MPYIFAEKNIHTPLQVNHVAWLRWIQEDVRIRAVELRELCHTDSNLRYARTTLAEKTIRCEPRCGGTLLDILAESDINGIVVFWYIAVDVVQASVADLDIDFASEYQF